MFHNAHVFNRDSSKWNTNKHCAWGTFSNTFAFNSDISSWNVSEVILMNNIFSMPKASHVNFVGMCQQQLQICLDILPEVLAATKDFTLLFC